MKRKAWFILGIGLCLMAAQPVFAQVQADIQKHASCQYTAWTGRNLRTAEW